MTDGLTAYNRVGAEFEVHKSTDHSAGVYVIDGVIHSNSAESYFAILKRGIFGNVPSVSEAHLHRYLSEFDFRYNRREALGVCDTERAEALLKGTKGKRLMYRQPTESANA